MIPVKAHLFLDFKGDTLLYLRNRMRYRIFYLAGFLLLLFGLIFGMDAEEDFSGSRLGGTLFYLVLLLVFLIQALLSRGFCFDIVSQRVYRVITLAGIQLPLVSSSRSLENARGVVVQRIVLLKRVEGEGRHRRLEDFFRQRSRLFKLYVELRDTKLLLAESTYVEEIEAYAQGISAFLQIPQHWEEI